MYVIICLLDTFPPGGYFYRTIGFYESSRFLTTFVDLISRFTKVVKKTTTFAKCVLRAHFRKCVLFTHSDPQGMIFYDIIDFDLIGHVWPG